MSESLVADDSKFSDYDRLKYDINDIDLALEQFSRERGTALQHQLNAKKIYEDTLKKLDDHYGVDVKMRSSVDHNMMRHLNISNPSDGNGMTFEDENYEEENFEENYGEDDNDQYLRDANGEVIELPGKKKVPSFDEKIEIREKLFSLLDVARLDELQLEMQIQELRDSIDNAAMGSNKFTMSQSLQGSSGIDDSLLIESINFNFEMHPEEKTVYKLESDLCELQLSNCGKVKDIFHEYQANAFSQAWGNDPDYIEVSNKLRDMLLKGDAVDVEALLAEKSKSKKKKKVKKTKR